MANATILRDGSEYDTLVDAVSVAIANDTIVLNADLSGSGIGLFASASNGILIKPLTIDFNCHTYTCVGPAVGSKGTLSLAFHLEANNDASHTPIDITLKNGTITTNSSKVLMVILNYDNLTLDNMVVDGTNLPTLNAVRYVVSNNNGDVQISNSTIIAAQDDICFDVCGYSVYKNVSVSTTNSTISGNIEVTSYDKGTNVHTVALNVGSGTTVTGKLVGDGSVKESMLSSTVTITKAANVALDIDKDKFGDYYFSENGKVITKEEHEKEQEEISKRVGAAYQLRVAAYVAQLRAIALYRWMMSHRR